MTDKRPEDGYEVEMPLELYFDTKEPIAIKDIATSLMALEKLSKRLPDLLTHLSGIEIEDHELKVSTIQTGSLIETLALIVFLSTPDQQQALRDYLETSPMGKPIKYTLLGFLIIALINDGYSILTNLTKDDAPAIQGNNNTVVNITAEQIGTTPEKLLGAIDQVNTRGRKELVKSSMDVAKPIANHEDASLYGGGVSSPVSIPPTAFKEVPFDAELSVNDKDVEFTDVLLRIRSLNRDSTETGWQGILPRALGEKKVRIVFAEGVDPGAATTVPEVRADVVITYKNDINNAVLVPKYVTVQRVYPLQSS